MKIVKRLAMTVATGALFASLTTPAVAQTEWEFGVLGLVSDYNSLTVVNATRDGIVGPELGFGGGVVLGQSLGERFGGEFRYLYSRNDINLDVGSERGELGHQSHAFHYDLLYHFTDFDAKVRPYLAGGIGVKYYQGTGREDQFQPGMDLALLTATTQPMFMADVGVGVEIRVGSNGIIRIEFRDYMTGIPDEVITAAPGAGIDGSVLHQFAPVFGYSWTW